VFANYGDVHAEVFEFKDVKQRTRGIVLAKVVIRAEDFAGSATYAGFGLSEEDVICAGFIDHNCPLQEASSFGMLYM
jgi:hypothetical protein